MSIEAGLLETLLNLLGAVFNFVNAVAASVGAALAWTYRRVRKIVQNRKLAAVFGQAARDAGNILVCLSSISLTRPSDQTPAMVYKVREGDVRNEVPWDNDENVYSREDVLAALEIGSIFTEQGSGQVSIVDDEEDFETNGKTLILVGLQDSNEIANDILENSDYNSSFNFEIVDRTTPRGVRFSFRLRDPTRWYESNDQYEYAVIAKVPNYWGDASKEFIFIVGGHYATGTLAAAKQLRQKWRDLVRLPVNSAAVVEMVRNSQERADLIMDEDSRPRLFGLIRVSWS